MINPLLLAGGGAAVLVALALALVPGDSRAAKRRAAVKRPAGRASAASQADKLLRRKQIADGLRDLEKAQRRRMTLRSRIEQAGLTLTPTQFYLASLATGLIAGLAVWVKSGNPIFAGLVAVIAAVGLPQFALKWLRARRIAKFIDGFPNAIDVVVRGVKSGMPLGDTLRVASIECEEPVRGELRRIVQATSIGLTLAESVDRMAQRVPVAETNFFAIVIAIQGQAGGNLSEALGNLSRVLRERKKMKAKVGAMSMEAKASAAIIGLVPFLVVGALYMSSPRYVSLLWTTEHGRVIGGIALGWMAVGVAIMKKMVTFEI
ncbi:MAG TPA: type II secretion system F family protein [Roseiarcus sp.]|nr:type II secretion system F family protein [Roseiarcus sp.]